MGVTVPQPIYSPEPTFSEEARKAKQQGIVTLLIIVASDGRPYDIHVRRSLGMGLDEKAIEAVSRWRFKPATLNGQPVATQIEVEVDFRLY
jgi:TonB family protein